MQQQKKRIKKCERKNHFEQQIIIFPEIPMDIFFYYYYSFLLELFFFFNLSQKLNDTAGILLNDGQTVWVE
jgi:hypothetical protein